ncbi:MAG: general secretion pathway protein GspF [Planctomycetaceae bacterium]|nr:general secretion pathway protein GspF [Planctomycetaceae bacterium]
MLSSKVSLKALSHTCRSLSTLLHSGVEVRKAFNLAAKKTTDPKAGLALGNTVDLIREGHDVSSALADQECFPELMVDMISVAEQTGMLPEVLAHLANHYENNVTLRREFLGQITWPVIQLVAAIFVVALLIVVFGAIGDGGAQMSFLVLGLSGVDGAIVWLTMTFGSIIGVFVAYKILTAGLAGKQFVDPLLMKIPVLGKCMRSFAIARFSWAYYLTQQSGMPIEDSIDASLRATGNGAFAGAAKPISNAIMAGDDLTAALAGSRLFPEDFIEMVAVAETSGTVPEALYRLSPQFEDQARRSLKTLTTVFSGIVWFSVAAFITFFIFRFVLWYVNMISDAAGGAF